MCISVPAGIVVKDCVWLQWNFFKINFYCYSITVVCLFSPSLHPTPAEPTSLPRLHPPPWFCPYVLYSSSCKPFSPLSPSHSPLAIVRFFLTSMSLVIFCLLFSFVDYVPVLIIFIMFKVMQNYFLLHRGCLFQKVPLNAMQWKSKGFHLPVFGISSQYNYYLVYSKNNSLVNKSQPSSSIYISDFLKLINSDNDRI